MSEHCVMARRRSRRLLRSAVPATPLDHDDLLGQILLRLPPSPSSLLRASLVCKRWRRVISGPYFLRSFRAHHRKAPLLGFLFQNHIGADIGFTPALDPPDRIAEARFTLQVRGYCFLGCRHGRVLAVDWDKHNILVWDPVTGHQLCLAAPSALRAVDTPSDRMNGAVICAATDRGHTHGACHSSPFQVVMVGTRWEGLSACIYSSETSSWGNAISMPWQSLFPVEQIVHPFIPISLKSTMLGSHICWLLMGPTGAAILQFDLYMQSFAVIEVPPGSYDNLAFAHGKCQFLVTRTDAGGIGFLVLSESSIRLWKRNVNSDGVTGWLLGNTVELSSLLFLSLDVYMKRPMIVGYAEDDNVIVLRTEGGVFMLQLETLQFNKLLSRMDQHRPTYLPFTSFYPAGT